MPLRFRNRPRERADPRDQGRVYKHDGEKWADCGAPADGNPGCLLPFAGKLYASTRDSIYEYEGGQAWTCIGARPHGVEQIHTMQVIGGKLHLGTWPQGYVLRYDGGSGAMAARLWWMLRSIGHANVQVLNGGLKAATDEGVELSTDEYKPAAAGLYPIPEQYRHTVDIEEEDACKSGAPCGGRGGRDGFVAGCRYRLWHHG